MKSVNGNGIALEKVLQGSLNLQWNTEMASQSVSRPFGYNAQRCRCVNDGACYFVDCAIAANRDNFAKSLCNRVPGQGCGMLGRGRIGDFVAYTLCAAYRRNAAFEAWNNALARKAVDDKEQSVVRAIHDSRLTIV